MTLTSYVSSSVILIRALMIAIETRKGMYRTQYDIEQVKSVRKRKRRHMVLSWQGETRLYSEMGKTAR